MTQTILRIALLSAAMLAPGAAMARPVAECRDVTMPDGSRTAMCKGADGRWVAQEAAGAVIPAKAEITYQGTYRMTAARRTRQSANSINLGNLLSNALNVNAKPLEGAITMKAKFDQAALTAAVTATGGLDPATLTGLVRGGTCRITNERADVVYEGRCSATGFSGTIKSTTDSRWVLNGTFSTEATAMVDIARREAEGAAKQRATDADNAAKKKVNDAHRAALKKQCDAGKLTACVEMDTLD